MVGVGGIHPTADSARRGLACIMSMPATSGTVHFSAVIGSLFPAAVCQMDNFGYNGNMSTLQNAIDALQAGQKKEALVYLKQAVTENPQDATTWAWLARALDDPARQQECLRRALRLEPENAFALSTLELLTKTPAAQPIDVPATVVEAPAVPVKPSATVQSILRKVSASAPPEADQTARLSRTELQAYLDAELVEVQPRPQPAPAASARAVQRAGRRGASTRHAAPPRWLWFLLAAIALFSTVILLYLLFLN